MTNASTADGREPVDDTRAWMRAAGEGDAERVRSLLGAGADPNAALESGETALIRAASKGHLGVVEILLAAGADPNAEREDGFTALGVAVFFGYVDIVRALLAGGADPAAKGRLGTTAEKWAHFSGFKEIVEMLRNPEAVGARDAGGAAAASTERAGAPEFFPTEGTFSPVVPLSKIDAAPASAAERGASALARPEVDELGIVPGADDRQEDADEWHEPKEQEVPTVVRARRTRATPPRPTPDARPQAARKSWPVALVAIALILVGAVIADAYWKRSRQSAESPRPESAETQPAAPVAGDAAAPAAEARPEALEPQPATATSDAQAPQPAGQLPEPNLPAEPDVRADARAPVAAAAEGGSRSEKVKRERDAAGRSAPPAAASEGRRAPRAEPASKREATVAASPRAARPTPNAVGERTGDRRRAPVAPGRARATEGRVLSSSSRDTSLPVFSPSPSPRSAKKKVIPWP